MTRTAHNFAAWELSDLVAYCKSHDNLNGEWDNVTEKERNYLIEVAERHQAEL